MKWSSLFRLTKGWHIDGYINSDDGHIVGVEMYHLDSGRKVVKFPPMIIKALQATERKGYSDAISKIKKVLEINAGG